jgi:DNA invertase Pin-like site-specific DNA recombinase
MRRTFDKEKPIVMEPRSSRIDTRHLERVAVVYVRQSTTQQTIHHTESTRLQYGLTERAISLGWSRDRIVVIDDDLGRSGATAEGRPGFQRLVAEVGLDHVGLILGIEMSRLARSCRDWYQLLEVCAIFRTLIADLDGVYDPANYNDRLLLGLKGTMSEAELHVLRQRLDQGRRNKAKRGELGLPVPIGYVRKPSGEVIHDPDEHVRAVVRIVFEQFERKGTINAVLTYLVRNRVKMPVRLVTGVNKGDVEWRRPNRTTLQQMLNNPIYAGAYAFGRTRIDARKKQPGRPSSGIRRVPRKEWPVLLKDRIPAYITWEQHEANLAQLEANRPSVMGAPRRGAALLSGLITCGKCGRRMSVIYGGGQHRYDCNAQKTCYGAESCMVSMGGRFLDEHIAQLIMKSLEPSALEVSLEVAANLENERRRLDEEWKHRLERAQFEVDRAFRQYNAVEPENRLVVRTLERQLEEKLTAQRALEEEHHRFLAEQPTLLTDTERAEIRALAADLPALWNATTTTPADKQMIIRQLVERVRIKPQGASEKLDVVVEWIGGHRTQLTLHRPVWRVDQLTYHQDLIRRMRQLHDDDNLSWREVADELNAEGWVPPRQHRGFSGANVRSMASKHGLAKAQRPKTALKKHERSLTELAYEIRMPTVTLMAWARRGWITARKLHEDGRSFWIVSAGPKDLAKIRAMRTATTARRSAIEVARA